MIHIKYISLMLILPIMLMSVGCEYNTASSDYDSIYGDFDPSQPEGSSIYEQRGVSDLDSVFEYVTLDNGMAYVSNFFEIPTGEDFGTYTEFERTFANPCFTTDESIVFPMWHKDESSEEDAKLYTETLHSNHSTFATLEQYEAYISKGGDPFRTSDGRVLLNPAILHESPLKTDVMVFDSNTYSFELHELEANTDVMLTDIPDVITDIGMNIQAIVQMQDGGFAAIVKETRRFDDYEIDNDLGNITYGFPNIVRWDADGKRIFELPMYHISEIDELYNRLSMYASKDGTIYIIFEYQLAAISSRGELLYIWEYPDEIAQMNNDSHPISVQYDTNGDVLFCYPELTGNMTGDFKYRCFYIDDDAEGLGDKVEFPSIGNFCPIFAEGYDVYFKGILGIYAKNFDSEYPVKLFDYSDIDIHNLMLRGLKIVNAEKMLVYITDPVEGHYKYGTIEAVPKTSLEKRKTITLAYERTLSSVAVSGMLTMNVANFNISNDDYRIELVEYNSDGDTSANEKLQKDIVAGNVPDMVAFANTLTSEPFIEHDNLYDIYSFMDSDEVYSRDKFLPCVLEPFELNGKLPYLTVDFMLETLVASKSNLGDLSVWSFEDFADAAASVDKGSYFIKLDKGSDSAAELLEKLIPNTLTSFVDYASSVCEFDSDFKTLLDLCTDAAVLFDSHVQNPALYESGEILLKSSQYSNIKSFSDDRYLDFTPETIAYVGYPTDDSAASQGTVIVPVTSLAITKQCDYPEGAWEFIKFYIASSNKYISHFKETPMAGYSINYFGCAWETVEALFELCKNAEMFVTTASARAAGTGEEYAYRSYVSRPLTDMSNAAEVKAREKLLSGVGVTSYTFGEADEAALRKLFSEITTAQIKERSAPAIIYEDASAYFSGIRSLDETAAMITERVTTLLEE